MAKSNLIISKGLEIPVYTNLDERGMFDLKKKLQAFANEYQDVLEAKIRAKADEKQIKDVWQKAFEQFNAGLKANNLEPLDMANFKDFEKPFEELGRQAAQRFMDGFGVNGGTMNAIAETVGKIYDKMGAQVESRIEAAVKYGSKTISELQDAGGRYGIKTKEGNVGKYARAVDDAVI